MRYIGLLFVILFGSLVAAAQTPITIYLAGDSTMAQKLPEKRPETGWGEALQKHFDPNKVRIDNRAQNGRSTKSFIAEKRWQAIVDSLKEGDYVFIQFGHNDESKDKGERYTPPDEMSFYFPRIISTLRSETINHRCLSNSSPS